MVSVAHAGNAVGKNERRVRFLSCRYMHYIKSIYGMIFCLTACGFSVFTLELDSLGDRIGTNFTLLLTMTTYKVHSVAFITIHIHCCLANTASLFVAL